MVLTTAACMDSCGSDAGQGCNGIGLASLTMDDIRNKLKSAGGPSAHGIGQKVSSKDLIKFLDPGKSGIQLMEMAYVVITESTTRLAGIETVALRNLETASRMYPGDIICEPKQVSCAARRSIGMHRYRSIVDTFATFQTTTQSVCSMEAPPIPVRVLLANSEAGRRLNDPSGYLDGGYMTSAGRLASMKNSISKYYVETAGVAKSNMGRRNPRSASVPAIGTLFPTWMSTFFKALIPGFPPLFTLKDVLRIKRSPKVSHSGQGEDPERWRVRRSSEIAPYIIGTLEEDLRVKRFSPIVAGMGMLAAGQMAQLIGTAFLEAKVSRLETRIQVLNLESKKVVKRIESSMSVLAKAIDLNSRFDEMGQLLGAIDGDLKEFVDVMDSMATQSLDRTTLQEGMGIVTEALATQAQFLTMAEAQTLTSMASRAQSALIEIKFEKETGLCRDAIRGVKYVTSVPFLYSKVNYCDTGVLNQFRDCNPALNEENAIFQVNPFNDFHHTIVKSGQELKMVTRTFQTFEGITLRFEPSENRMEDVFTLILEKQESIEATTYCDGEFTDKVILTNNSRLSNPLQCGINSPYNLFFRGIDVRADNEKREGKLLDNVINSKGLKVSVMSNEVEDELNEIMQDQDNGLLEMAEAGYSSTTYIMFGVGILAVVAIGMAALVISTKDTLMKLLVGQTRRNQLARRAARTSSVELGLESESAVVVHCEGKDDSKRVKMLVL